MPRTRRMRSLRSVGALILREMGTTYGRSPGGYLWAILSPLGAITLLTFAFSLFLHAPSTGNNFALFYATGYLPFALYTDVTSTTATALRFSKPLLAYPAVTYTDAIFARFILTTGTQLMVFFVIVPAIIATYRLRLIFDVPAVLLSFVMAAALGLGIGTLNCFLMSRFPAWEKVWQIGMRPLFLISGVFYVLEDLPRDAREILWYNPLLHVSGEMRKGFFATYDATYVSPAYVFGIAMTCFALGLLLLNRHHRDILNS
jgi:capsular polysaccharide transport system permease protein